MNKLNPQLLVTCAKAHKSRLNAAFKWIDAAQPPNVIAKEICIILAKSPIPNATHYKILHIRDFGETALYQLGSIHHISKLGCFLKRYGQLGDCLINRIGLSKREARTILDNPVRKFSYIACMVFLYLLSLIIKEPFRPHNKHRLKFKVMQLKWVLEDLTSLLQPLSHQLRRIVLIANYSLCAKGRRLKFNVGLLIHIVKQGRFFHFIETAIGRFLKTQWRRLKARYFYLQWRLKNNKLIQLYFD